KGEGKRREYSESYPGSRAPGARRRRPLRDRDLVPLTIRPAILRRHRWPDGGRIMLKQGSPVHSALMAGALGLGVGLLRPAHAAQLPTVPAAVQAMPSNGAVLITYSTALNAVA